jgi:hypothetical protein
MMDDDLADRGDDARTDAKLRAVMGPDIHPTPGELRRMRLTRRRRERFHELRLGKTRLQLWRSHAPSKTGPIFRIVDGRGYGWSVRVGRDAWRPLHERIAADLGTPGRWRYLLGGRLTLIRETPQTPYRPEERPS